MFPPHIEAVLVRYGIRADTRSALYDLYRMLGSEVLEIFAEMSVEQGDPSSIGPEELEGIHEEVVDRYLTKNHQRWVRGEPSESLWRPAIGGGQASGLTVPLGRLGTSGETSDFASRVERKARHILGDDQPIPAAMLMLGRNAHFGGRAETISFDLVAASFDDASALAKAEGRQHTSPGSAGEASGTFDAVFPLGLIWEIQPNVLKPGDGRNASISKLFRKHRNWHVITLVAALEWLRDREALIYVIRGQALKATHEVNPGVAVSETIENLHDRTVERVVVGMGAQLSPPTDRDAENLKASEVGNVGFGKWLEREGVAASVWRVDFVM